MKPSTLKIKLKSMDKPKELTKEESILLQIETEIGWLKKRLTSLEYVKTKFVESPETLKTFVDVQSHLNNSVNQ